MNWTLWWVLKFAREERYVAWTNRVAGLLLILAGVGLGFLK